MLFSNLEQLLRHFGFQWEKDENFDRFQRKAGTHKALVQIHSDHLEWSLPKDKRQAYMSNYKADPYFFTVPEKIAPSDDNLVTYSISMAWKDYDELIELVEFLQSGCVDAIYMEGSGYYYPDIIAEHNSVLNTSSNQEDEIKEYIEALNRYPNNAILHNCIGKLYIQNGDFKRASSYFVNASELEPLYAEPYSNMGTLLWREGSKEKAFQLFYEGMLRNPFDEVLQDNFIMSGIDLGEVERMNHCLSRIQEYFPDYSSLLYLKAILLEKLGLDAECMAVLHDFLKRYPEDERAQNFLNEMENG